MAQLDVDWVAHCAAYTAVDRAESEKDLAHEINCEGSAAVARGAQRSGARLLYVSTDYVFDGRACEPYIPDAPTGPVNVYGVTKRAGEQAVERDHAAPLTVRTSWIKGGQGPNFAATMMQLGRERDALSVIDDQRGRPTWAPDLAPGLVRLMEAQAVGVLHLANEG